MEGRSSSDDADTNDTRVAERFASVVWRSSEENDADTNDTWVAERGRRLLLLLLLLSSRKPNSYLSSASSLFDRIFTTIKTCMDFWDCGSGT